MPRSLLIGLDGSSYSDTAAELGIRWARQYDALLVGLGVVDEPTIRTPQPMPIGGSSFKGLRDEALLESARQSVGQFLQQFAARCAQAQVRCRLIEEVGLPAEAICQESQRYDLIVLGKRTYYQFETRRGPDQTLADVLKNGPRPVVTVPEKLPQGTATLVAYDGSLQAARTVQMLAALQLNLGFAVHVLSVQSDGEQATRVSQRAVDFLAHHGIQAQLHAVESPHPAEAILAASQRLSAGLVVMGAYGQPALREFFFGSVTRRLLAESTVPLLLYH